MKFTRLTGLLVTAGMITPMILGLPTALAGESIDQIVTGRRNFFTSGYAGQNDRAIF